MVENDKTIICVSHNLKICKFCKFTSNMTER